MSVYTIASMWRYPVKSMAGESVEAVDVTERGLTGDRAYALMDSAANRIGTAKSTRKFGSLLDHSAEFVTAPVPGEPAPPVRITVPGGAVLRSDQPDEVASLTSSFGPGVSFISTAPAGLMLSDDFPVASGAPAGTLFDYASLHIVTTATLGRLRAQYPVGEFAIERFRPNVLIDGNAGGGFVENDWVGRTLAIGPELVVRVILPCPRCVITTLPQGEFTADPGILRTAAEHNKQQVGDFGQLPCVGVYADVVTPGRISRNDVVRVAD
jgi:MOSC domain-containing protein